MTYSKAILMGRLTRDPEVRYTNDGTAVANFCVAVDSGYGDKKSTAFVDCVCFGKRGDALGKHFHKGDPIHLDGEIRQDKWEDKTTGKQRTALKVAVFNWNFVPKTSGGTKPEQEAPPEDVPF